MNSTTRVLLCEQNLSVPEDTRVWREALTLTRAGYDVTVICPRSEGRFREEREGVHIRRYPVPTLDKAPVLLGQIAETAIGLLFTLVYTICRLRHGKVAVLHAANPPDTFFLIAWLLRPFGTKFVFDQHDLVPELLEARTNRATGSVHRLFRMLERCSYRRADLVLVPNDSYRSVAIERGKCDPVRVVTVRSGPDAVDIAKSTMTSTPVIVFAGMMGPQDGLETLLDAIALLEERNGPTFTVELIGRGSEVEQLQQRARALGIAELISWTGWLDQEALKAHLRSATIAVSPDDDTQFNRKSTMTKIAEYLAFGLPTVVADLPESRVTAGDAAAVFYAPNDSHDLARRIEELLTDGSLRDELRCRARHRAALLTWEQSEPRLISAYRCLLDNDARFPDDDQAIEDVSR